MSVAPQNYVTDAAGPSGSSPTKITSIDSGAGSQGSKQSSVPDPSSVAEEVIGSVIALTVAASAIADPTSETGADEFNKASDVHDVWRDTGWGTDAELWELPDGDAATGIPFHLDGASDRQLRRWGNELFEALSGESPSFMVVDDYARITEEIERREAIATVNASPPGFRESFRDNTRGRRFELFRNGVLTGYVAYSIRAGVLRLNTTVVHGSFENQNVESALIHEVLLSAHRRRLAVVAYCQKAQEFLRSNPQYQQLIHA